MVQSLQTNAGGLVEGLARYITNHARQRRRLRQSTLEVRGVIVQAEETALAAAGGPRRSAARAGTSVDNVEPGGGVDGAGGSQSVLVGDLLDYLESMGDTFAASFEAAKQVGLYTWVGLYLSTSSSPRYSSNPTNRRCESTATRLPRPSAAFGSSLRWRPRPYRRSHTLATRASRCRGRR